MSRLSSLPRDIYLTSLLPYFEPKDLDAYCSSSPELESWCKNSDNIRSYLISRNISFSNSDEGLIWAIKLMSHVLMNYFTSLGANPLLYIEPQDLDIFCQTYPQFESWCSNPDDIHFYLAIRGKSFSSSNEGLLWAVENNSIILAQYFILNGAKNFDRAMAEAARNGNIKIVELMLRQGAKNFDRAMAEAAENGHVKIVLLMLKKGAKTYNWAMTRAAYGGHIDIVNLMIYRGADNYDQSMLDASRGGHINIIELMLDLGADNYNATIIHAKPNKRQEIENFIDNYRLKYWH